MREDHIKQIKEGNSQTFYMSYVWRKKRLEILERDNHECQICKEEGRVTTETDKESLIVHHIKELKEFPELGLDNDNLISVCRYCHEVKCHPERLKKQEPKINIPERW